MRFYFTELPINSFMIFVLFCPLKIDNKHVDFLKLWNGHVNDVNIISVDLVTPFTLFVMVDIDVIINP